MEIVLINFAGILQILNFWLPHLQTGNDFKFSSRCKKPNCIVEKFKIHFHPLCRTVRIWETRSTKAIATIPTKGENINIAWAPDGKTIAVGNKEDLVTFIDAKSHKIVREEQFKFEVNEISWSRPSDLLFLTNGQVRKS